MLHTMRGACIWLLMALMCPAAQAHTRNPAPSFGTPHALLAFAPASKAKGKKKSKTNAPRPGQKQTKNGKPAGPAVNAPAPPKAALAPPPPLPTRYRGVALLPVLAYEVDDELVQAQTGALLNEIDEIQGLQSVSPQDVVTETLSFGLHVDSCERDLACLAQAGRYSRAHLAMEVRLSGLGGTLIMSVRLIDTVKPAEVARVAEPLSDDQASRLQQTHRIVVQLLNPTAYVGGLSVTCPTAGAEVYLDDKLLGQTPLPTQSGVPAGLHILRVSKAGFSDINRFVDVVYNRASTVQVDFNDITVSGVIVEQVSPTGFGELYLLSSEPGLEVRIDGEPVGITPLRGSIAKVAAGKRHISLRKAGQPPVTVEVEVMANLRNDMALRAAADGAPVLQTLGAVPASQPLPDQELALAPKAPLAVVGGNVPATEPGTFNSFPTWRYYTGIGCGVVAAGGLVTGSLLARQVKQFDTEARTIAAEAKTANWDLQTRTAKAKRLAELNRKGPQAVREQWVSLGAGGVLLLTGAGLIMWDLVRTEPAPTPQGAGPASAPSPPTQGLVIPTWDFQYMGLVWMTTW